MNIALPLQTALACDHSPARGAATDAALAALCLLTLACLVAGVAGAWPSLPAVLGCALACTLWCGSRAASRAAAVASAPADMEAVFDAYVRALRRTVARVVADAQILERGLRVVPVPLLSALTRGCLERGLDLHSGGAERNSGGVQAVGLADVVDSLAALEDVVYAARGTEGGSSRFTYAEVMRAVRGDFAGPHGAAVRAALRRAPKYGNDAPAADAWARRVMTAVQAALDEHVSTRGGGRYVAGYYSMTCGAVFGRRMAALPSGRRARESLSNGAAPADGVELAGPTAVLRSVASIPAAAASGNGMSVNLRLQAGLLGGARGATALAALIRGYFASGGMQLQVRLRLTCVTSTFRGKMKFDLI